MLKPETLALCASDLADALTRWERYLHSEKHASPHTIRAYTKDIRDFLEFLLHYRGGEAPSLNSVSSANLRDFWAWLAEQINNGASAATRARSIAGVRSFLNWADKNGLMHNAAAALIRTPKKPHRLPRPLYEKQAKAVSVEKDAETWIQARDRALFTLLYGAGLRIAEALALDIKNLPRDGFLRVMGKGEKERQVPIIREIEQEIDAYRAVCPWPETPDRPLFLGTRGGRLHQGVAQRVMRILRASLDLPETATPHALRHSFATHLLQNGANLREIQEMLGHASLSSTQIYADLDMTALMETYKKAHPRA